MTESEGFIGELSITYEDKRFMESHLSMAIWNELHVKLPLGDGITTQNAYI